MGELFDNRLNLKGLMILVSGLCWCHMGVVVIPIYLFLPWNKIFFGLLMAQTLDFGMIDASDPMNWNGGPVEKAADGIHNDKNVCSMWVWYIPSRALLFSFLIL